MIYWLALWEAFSSFARFNFGTDVIVQAMWHFGGYNMIAAWAAFLAGTMLASFALWFIARLIASKLTHVTLQTRLQELYHYFMRFMLPLGWLPISPLGVIVGGVTKQKPLWPVILPALGAMAYSMLRFYTGL